MQVYIYIPKGISIHMQVYPTPVVLKQYALIYSTYMYMHIYMEYIPYWIYLLGYT